MQINLPFDIGDDLWWMSDETMEVCCDEGGIRGVAIREDGIYLIDRCGEQTKLHSQYGCLTREEAEAFLTTNADRVRSMSDEELAQFLYEVGYDEGWEDAHGALCWLKGTTFQRSDEDEE